MTPVNIIYLYILVYLVKEESNEFMKKFKIFSYTYINSYMILFILLLQNKIEDKINWYFTTKIMCH